MSSSTIGASSESQKGCWFATRSDNPTSVKLGIASITVALAAIVLLGGLLIILAQQGYHLGGINSIAQMIEPKWVYLGVSISAGIAIVSVIVIIAQMRGSSDENAFDVSKDPYLADYEQQVLAPLQKNEYWKFNAQREGQALHSIAYKTETRTKIQHFNTQEQRDTFVARLPNAAVNAQDRFNPNVTYTKEELASLVKPDVLISLKSKSELIGPQQYKCGKLSLEGDHQHLAIYTLAVATEPPTLFYFKTDKTRREYIGIMGIYVDESLLQQKESEAEASLVSAALIEVGDFWTLAIVGDLVRVYYMTETGSKATKILKETEISVWGANLLKKNVLDELSKYYQYPKAFGEALVALRAYNVSYDRESRKMCNLSQEEFGAFELNTLSSRFPKPFILAIKTKAGMVEFLYFQSESARNRYFQDKGLVNIQKRWEQEEMGVNCMGPLYDLEQIGDRKHLLFVFSSPDNASVRFIIFTGGKIINDSCHLVDQVNALLDSHKDQYRCITQDEWVNRSMSDAEIDVLENKIQKTSILISNKRIPLLDAMAGHLKNQKQYIVFNFNGHKTLLSRSEDVENKPQYNFRFFRDISSPSYSERVQELKGFTQIFQDERQ